MYVLNSVIWDRLERNVSLSFKQPVFPLKLPFTTWLIHSTFLLFPGTVLNVKACLKCDAVQQLPTEFQSVELHLGMIISDGLVFSIYKGAYSENLFCRLKFQDNWTDITVMYYVLGILQTTRMLCIHVYTSLLVYCVMICQPSWPHRPSFSCHFGMLLS